MHFGTFLLTKEHCSPYVYNVPSLEQAESSRHIYTVGYGATAIHQVDAVV